FKQSSTGSVNRRQGFGPRKILELPFRAKSKEGVSMKHENPMPASADQLAPGLLAVPRSGTNGEETASFSDHLLTSMLSFREGDFSVRMPNNLTGVEGKIADAFNSIVLFSDQRAKETVRVSIRVGKEGKLKQRMNVPQGVGRWAEEVSAIN